MSAAVWNPSSNRFANIGSLFERRMAVQSSKKTHWSSWIQICVRNLMWHRKGTSTLQHNLKRFLEMVQNDFVAFQNDLWPPWQRKGMSALNDNWSLFKLFKSYELVVSEMPVFSNFCGLHLISSAAGQCFSLGYQKTHQTPKKSTTIAEAYLSVPKNPKTCGNIQQTSRKPLESAE